MNDFKDPISVVAEPGCEVSSDIELHATTATSSARRSAEGAMAVSVITLVFP